jgi:3-polyprenyl-4-hydroxybenzoate decarboxylase
MKDLREFIDVLEAHDQLLRVDTSLYQPTLRSQR